MKNLTIELLNGYVNGLESEAKKAVFETLSLEDIETVFEHGCSVGVGGFTYYHETESFFDEYTEEILEFLEYMKQEHGTDIFKYINFTKNDLTWLFVEETVKTFIYEEGLDD